MTSAAAEKSLIEGYVTKNPPCDGAVSRFNQTIRLMSQFGGSSLSNMTTADKNALMWKEIHLVYDGNIETERNSGVPMMPIKKTEWTQSAECWDCGGSCGVRIVPQHLFPYSVLSNEYIEFIRI